MLGPTGEIPQEGPQGSPGRRKQSQEVSGLRWGGRWASRRKSEVTIPTPRVWWANRKFLFVAKQ